MSILHLTSVHEPHDERILLKECSSLAAHGYDVSLVAPGVAPASIHGVRILTVPCRNGRLQRMIGTVWDVLRAVLASDAKVCHFHDPELIPVGLILKLAGRKVVYDVHESVPAAILTKYWINPMLRRFVAMVVDVVERSSQLYIDHFVVATPAIAARFPSARRTLVRNFPLQREFAEGGDRLYQQRSGSVVFVGGLTRARGALEMVRAMGLVDAKRAGLVLAGRFQEPDLEQACKAEPGWRNVDFLGWKAREEVVGILADAKVGLVLFQATPNYVEAMPIKLFEYMAAGVPVVASDFPLWRQIVEGEQCGLLVDPADPDAIAGAIEWVLEHPDEAGAMGQRGREAVLTRLNWDSEAQKLLALYQRLLA
jgi:glycosyltransferase involved in cell wall biosynthesis